MMSIEQEIRIIEEQYQQRYIQTLEEYRQKVSSLRNELYCEVRSLTIAIDLFLLFSLTFDYLLCRLED
jgi:hypothetical protein